MEPVFAASTDKELNEAEADMLASTHIVEILEEALVEARKQQRESRDKYIALCGKAVAQ